MSRIPNSRQPVSLSQSLRRKLDSYFLAAGATGIGLAALASPAPAEVVFTPAHQQIGRKGVVLDLNHDGTADFEILQRNFFADGFGIIVYSHLSNRAFSAASRANFLSMLPFGYTVGPNSARFKRGSTSTNDPIPHKFLYYCEANSGGRSCTGAWDKGTSGSYVGFKVFIDGEAHYGWARLKVTVQGPDNPKSVYLTGYAYESVANKPIVAGETSGTSDSSTKEFEAPATLGMLSAGAPSLPLWRLALQ